MPKNIRIYDRFEYHLEDLDCSDCLHRKKQTKRGCGLAVCLYEDIRTDATTNGRVKRKRGWNKWQE